MIGSGVAGTGISCAAEAGANERQLSGSLTQSLADAIRGGLMGAYVAIYRERAQDNTE